MTHRLANPAVELTFAEDGLLQVANRLSGSSRTLHWPAFRVEIAGHVLDHEGCSLQQSEARPEEVTLHYRHEPTGLGLEVAWTLWGQGFRKSLHVVGEGLPTPERVYVDLQPVQTGEVTITGFEAKPAEFGEVRDQEGEETSYGTMPGCGYPVYVGDWFVGLEHPAAFTVVREGLLQAYHHPIWQEGGLASPSLVWGAASSPEAIPAAFARYLQPLRLPPLRQFIVSLCTFWSDPYVGNMEYEVSTEGYLRYLQAMLDLGVVPDVLTLDAGWHDRRSILHYKDDRDDSRLRALAEEVRAHGIDLSLWISRNGPMGFDPEWARQQGYAVGKGRASSYSGEDYLVMLDRAWERDLGQRLEVLAGTIGARHFKIDWDNECASNEGFSDLYPTPDHVREETLKVWARLHGRMARANPQVVTRDGWWPSPWWLASGSHLWLSASGDCEYAALPSRTQRDRALTHRDAMMHKILVTDHTPLPLDCWDNHEFPQAPRNPIQEQPHTWLDNLVLAFTRGTSYLTLFLNPEALSEEQAGQLRAVLAWARQHAPELLGVEGRMVGGDPALGEVYGYLHRSETGAWLVLRNPSVTPQTPRLQWREWLGAEPGAVWQVYPYWERVGEPRPLLGHEVTLLRVFHQAPADFSPLPGAPFLLHETAGGWQCLFPGSKALTPEIGPQVAPLMQIPELLAESPLEGTEEAKAWRQWFVTVPYRMQQPELLVTLRGPQEVLDRVTLTASTSRYQGGRGEHVLMSGRIHRKETHGYGTRRFMPPVGERTRDDYVFALPAGGRFSLTAEATGAGAEDLEWEAWLTGWEAPARQGLALEQPPLEGPQLPPHPYGFARSLRL